MIGSLFLTISGDDISKIMVFESFPEVVTVGLLSTLLTELELPLLILL